MAIHDFRSQRLFLEASLATDTRLEATREQANYLLNVLRLKNGDQILLFNGKDGEWRSAIEVSGRKSCSLWVKEQNRQQPKPSGIEYMFAPLKHARLDYMVQKAVEMGANVLQPVITRHTQVRTINTKRIKANAIEAAEQCGILNIPEIREARPLTDYVQQCSLTKKIFFCNETLSGKKDRLDETIDGERDLAILIGPEGGFSTEEINYLNGQKNVIPISLGPRILRADTAAVAAFSIIQQKYGDWKIDHIT